MQDRDCSVGIWYLCISRDRGRTPALVSHPATEGWKCAYRGGEHAIILQIRSFCCGWLQSPLALLSPLLPVIMYQEYARCLLNVILTSPFVSIIHLQWFLSLGFTTVFDLSSGIDDGCFSLIPDVPSVGMTFISCTLHGQRNKNKYAL